MQAHLRIYIVIIIFIISIIHIQRSISIGSRHRTVSRHCISQNIQGFRFLCIADGTFGKIGTFVAIRIVRKI